MTTPTDDDRLRQIRELEAALCDRNAELKRVRDQRDALRVERDNARREVCAMWDMEEPEAEAARRDWNCFEGINYA
jgi:hypothetical protein